MNSLEHNLDIPPDAWDTHLHVYDQTKFPFKPNRHYTPESVNLDDALKSILCTNLVLVQASFEDGYEGILTQLQDAQTRCSNRKIRAEIIWDPAIEADAEVTERLHRAGVRCLRIHGQDGRADGNNLEWVKKAFDVACAVANRHGWAVAAQLPLSTWLALAPHIDRAHSTNSIIVEHLGSPPMAPLTTEQQVEFTAFVDWVAHNPRVLVKISGLYRRGDPDSEKSIHGVSDMIKQLANRAPHALLYGSDFPHVDVQTMSLSSTALLDVDREAEMFVVRDSVGPDVWPRMLVDNPARIFA